jgi:hypothetical protein
MLKLCESGHEPLAYDDRRHECPACVIGENLTRELVDVKDALEHTQGLLEEADAKITELEALFADSRRGP